uniref:Phospholipase A2-like central domain-containing protein n=1 Tax=Mola mola TaxID=94237 RepID=A0A3Q3X902_MOLML
QSWPTFTPSRPLHKAGALTLCHTPIIHSFSVCFFMGADRCCREHDHCQHTIAGLTAKYGFFNRKLYTISHCDCDQRAHNTTHLMETSVSLALPTHRHESTSKCPSAYQTSQVSPQRTTESTTHKPALELHIPTAITEETTAAPPTTTHGLWIKVTSLCLCGSLKLLDDCAYKIRPLKKRYGLQNMESKIVYHCDCTSR